MENRNLVVKQNFARCILEDTLPEDRHGLTPNDVGLTDAEVIDLVETQIMSRHLDLQSRLLQARGESFYTIGSAGHEGNAAYGKAFRVSDMAFLHYRSGAFMIQRSKQLPGETPLYDMLLSFAASADDPISGGRHKVMGSKRLNIPPQTSTIASHLPKAVGAAYSIGLANRIDFDAEMQADGVIVCNFGDASSNHSTTQGAINAALWTSYQNVAMPIVFICEDNGIGISTATPKGWVAANFSQRPGLHYIHADGLDVLDTYRQSMKAARIAREKQQPVFLHVRTVRLLGHAGSDAEIAYRKKQEILDIEAQDPLLHSARIILDNGIMDKDSLIAMYDEIERRVARIAEQAITRPRLSSAEDIMASIAPQRSPKAAPEQLAEDDRLTLFKSDKHNLPKPQHMGKLINFALADLMAQYQNIIMCGEDIGKKGGVYHVTSKLVEKFGKNRVLNTLLDEQTILGLAIGAAHNGFLPMPEIQFLAYVHNAEDQIRGEAATLSFFSSGQFQNGMVIRIAGLAYQKGFGGHFHNDNSFAVFRDIPGVVIACPSNGADAVEMMREAVHLAYEQKRVVVFLEPIALYMTRDLHEEGDGLWTSVYRPPAQAEPIGLSEFGQRGEGTDLAIISYGNGFYLSCQAQKQLQEQGVNARVIDLRWLSDIDYAGLAKCVEECEQILIVDECRHTGSLSEGLMSGLLEQGIDAQKLCRMTAEDSFIPLAKAAYDVLPSCDGIVAQALALCTDKASKVVNMKGQG